MFTSKDFYKCMCLVYHLDKIAKAKDKIHND